MDDPLRWGKVRRSINRAIEKHKLQTDEGIRGSSLVTMIFQELRANGHVAEEDEPDEEDNFGGSKSPASRHKAGLAQRNFVRGRASS